MCYISRIGEQRESDERHPKGTAAVVLEPRPEVDTGPVDRVEVMAREIAALMASASESADRLLRAAEQRADDCLAAAERRSEAMVAEAKAQLEQAGALLDEARAHDRAVSALLADAEREVSQNLDQAAHGLSRLSTIHEAMALLQQQNQRLAGAPAPADAADPDDGRADAQLERTLRAAVARAIEQTAGRPDPPDVSAPPA